MGRVCKPIWKVLSFGYDAPSWGPSWCPCSQRQVYILGSRDTTRNKLQRPRTGWGWESGKAVEYGESETAKDTRREFQILAKKHISLASGVGDTQSTFPRNPQTLLPSKHTKSSWARIWNQSWEIGGGSNPWVETAKMSWIEVQRPQDPSCINKGFGLVGQLASMAKEREA